MLTIMFKYCALGSTGNCPGYTNMGCSIYSTLGIHRVNINKSCPYFGPRKARPIAKKAIRGGQQKSKRSG